MSVKAKPRPIVLVGERDGWFCHYCRVPLVPVGHEAEFCKWNPPVVSWDHCGCGQHDLVNEPCSTSGCWTWPEGWGRAEIDHMRPRADGGSNDLANLVAACGDCNSRKRATPYDTFICEYRHDRPRYGAPIDALAREAIWHMRWLGLV